MVDRAFVVDRVLIVGRTFVVDRVFTVDRVLVVDLAEVRLDARGILGRCEKLGERKGKIKHLYMLLAQPQRRHEIFFFF